MSKMGRIPDRWTFYKPMGKRIQGTRFIAFRGPLKESLCGSLDGDDRFTPQRVLQICPDIRFVVDLTNTNKYYDSQEFKRKGVEYEKVSCPGHVIPPFAAVMRFFKVVDGFLDRHKADDSLIGVHCTHGVNRTGYMIVRYMVQRMRIPLARAIDSVEKARGHKIERENYINNLKRCTSPVPSRSSSPTRENWRLKEAPRQRAGPPAKERDHNSPQRKITPSSRPKDMLQNRPATSITKKFERPRYDEGPSGGFGSRGGFRSAERDPPYQETAPSMNPFLGEPRWESQPHSQFPQSGQHRQFISGDYDGRDHFVEKLKDNRRCPPLTGSEQLMSYGPDGYREERQAPPWGYQQPYETQFQEPLPYRQLDYGPDFVPFQEGKPSHDDRSRQEYRPYEYAEPHKFFRPPYGETWNGAEPRGYNSGRISPTRPNEYLTKLVDKDESGPSMPPADRMYEEKFSRLEKQVTVFAGKPARSPPPKDIKVFRDRNDKDRRRSFSPYGRRSRSREDSRKADRPLKRRSSFSPTEDDKRRNLGRPYEKFPKDNRTYMHRDVDSVPPHFSSRNPYSPYPQKEDKTGGPPPIDKGLKQPFYNTVTKDTHYKSDNDKRGSRPRKDDLTPKFGDKGRIDKVTNKLTITEHGAPPPKGKPDVDLYNAFPIRGDARNVGKFGNSPAKKVLPPRLQERNLPQECNQSDRRSRKGSRGPPPPDAPYQFGYFPRNDAFQGTKVDCEPVYQSDDVDCRDIINHKRFYRPEQDSPGTFGQHRTGQPFEFSSRDKFEPSKERVNRFTTREPPNLGNPPQFRKEEFPVENRRPLKRDSGLGSPRRGGTRYFRKPLGPSRFSPVRRGEPLQPKSDFRKDDYFKSDIGKKQRNDLPNKPLKMRLGPPPRKSDIRAPSPRGSKLPPKVDPKSRGYAKKGLGRP